MRLACRQQHLRAGGGRRSYGSFTTGTAPGWKTTAWQEGVQYVRFTNVTVRAGQPVTLTVLPGEGGYAVISGLQYCACGAIGPGGDPSGRPAI